MEKVTPEDVKDWFGLESVTDHYAAATIDLGLWQSEELVLPRVFDRESTLLELGCGTGRIAIGLWELGYRGVLATDLSREMIAKARELARKLEYAIPMRVADARRLPMEDALFDGVIFGFNGLMQIPGRAGRCDALREMARVVKPGGRAVLTTHDRAVGAPDGFWAEEAARWAKGEQDERLHELGDRIVASDHGPIFIHIPTFDDVREDLEASGWRVVESAMRSEICEESAAVEAFSVDCRFWVARRETN